jgi:hypothetical protein
MNKYAANGKKFSHWNAAHTEVTGRRDYRDLNQ